MNKKTMLERLKAGYNPIIVSIEKWLDIQEEMNKPENAGKKIEDVEWNGSCALCKVNEGTLGCNTYLLYQYEGCMCLDSKASYEKAHNANDPQIMLDALYAVLKEEKKKCADEQKDILELESEPEPEPEKKYNLVIKNMTKDDALFLIHRLYCSKGSFEQVYKDCPANRFDYAYDDYPTWDKVCDALEDAGIDRFEQMTGRKKDAKKEQ